MKFIYFLSKEYIWFDQKIKENLSGLFEVEAIPIESIRKKEGHAHSFAGNSIKIDLIIDKIKENFGEYIIFSDANIIINKKNKTKLEASIQEKINQKIDLVFIHNNDNDIYNNTNIALSLIKCTQETLMFFQKVKENIKKGRLLRWAKGWDQAEVNYCIRHESRNLKIEKFDRQKFWVNSNAPKHIVDDYYLIKMTGRHYECPKQTLRNKIDNLLRSRVITKEEYDECNICIER